MRCSYTLYYINQNRDIFLPEGDSQQSAPDGKCAGQLFDPQIRFPWHSESLSQSPSLIAQGAPIEQHSLSKFVPSQDLPKILKKILTGYFMFEHSGDLYYNFVNFWLKIA